MQTGKNLSGWKIDKTINLSHLLPVVAMVFSAFFWAYQIDSKVRQNAKEISLVKREQSEINSEVKRFEKKIEALRIEIKSDLKDINTKLDRLIEKRIVNG